VFAVSVNVCFWASHSLRLPDGSVEPAHSHNWVVTAEFAREKLDGSAFVADFGKLRAMLAEVVSCFNNQALEQTDYFRRNNPSAENVAKYIFLQLEPRLPADIRLNYVSVEEEPGCSAKFFR